MTRFILRQIPRRRVVYFTLLYTLLSLFWSLEGYSQKGTISGIVKDAETGETLVGVNVLADSAHGVSTDTKGSYLLKLDAGIYFLTFSYIGYQEEKRQVEVERGQIVQLNLSLEVEKFELGMAVITAGKFRQKLSDVSVSMAIIQPEFIENTNTVSMETVISQMPGIDIFEGQASIRGGSGYNFGAGSRVQLLVDDVPMLTAGANEIKWNFLPVEHIQRVEILKGASSALYGSSALNGVINILTEWPDEKPETRVNLYGGLYNHPKSEEMAWWWDRLPAFTGGSFSTAHKLGTVDLVAGANVFYDEGYREENYEERGRANVKFRHRPQNITGLSYGISSSIQWQNTSDFLLWRDADSGAFLQRQDAIAPTTAFRFNADPWVIYYDQKNNRHSLKTRYYQVSNSFEFDPIKNSSSELYYGEYQFQRTFQKKLNLTAGFTGTYGLTDANIFGDHKNSSLAVYTQLDYTLNHRLTLSAGLRWERYTLDKSDRESSPVARAGVSYKLANYTFIRASYGQGYRFPSIAEKYTTTTVGSLNIFPNPELNPETGWSTELAIKQGFQLAKWKGFFDIAGFWTEYQDMIEFTFGVWLQDSTQIPTIDDIGFKSLNVGQARINGLEINLTGTGTAARMPLTFFAGYTYMNPQDLTNDTLENNILKYRYRHTFKGDIQADPGKFSAGVSFRYHSYLERIDEAFEDRILGQEIFPGLKNYRLENNTGNIVIDARIAYQLTKAAKLSLLVKNLFNEEYMERPGDIQPPRNITLHLLVKF